MRHWVFSAFLLGAFSCKQSTSNPQPPDPRAEASATATAGSASSTTSAIDAAPPAEQKSAIPTDLNVILLSIDSLRADMPWSGYARPIAPRLTELEKKAVTFTRAYSISSYTSMSIGGLLSGLLPSELKRSGFFFGSYPKENLFFPELLQAAKVHTLGVHAHFYFKDAGFQQGFDRWELVKNISADNTTDKNVTSPQSEEISEKLLSDPSLDSKRFFFWAHFLDPHDVYLPHQGVGPYGKSERDKYDAEVEFTDQYIGRLLDFIAARPWAMRTMVIITSDHGEAFGEHGMMRHGFELWENLVHVPFMIVVPGVAPRHIDEPRSAIDIAPTILDVFGVEKPPTMKGESLFKEVQGGKAEPRDVFVDLPATSDNDWRRGVIRGKQKVICFTNDNACKLFDLEADPTEEHPISSGDTFRELQTALKSRSKLMKELAPTACGSDCLNGAYLKKAKP